MYKIPVYVGVIRSLCVGPKLYVFGARTISEKRNEMIITVLIRGCGAVKREKKTVQKLQEPRCQAQYDFQSVRRV